MSTSLDDLDGGAIQQSQGGGGDERRVNNIMAEFTATPVVQPQPQPPQYSPQVINVPPLSNSMGAQRMDPGTAHAHIIGSSTPSAADFQSMFQQRPATGPAQNYASQVWTPTHQVSIAESKPWKEIVLQFLRGPIAVAIIVFLLNMPIVTSIFSRNAQWMYLISGEISVSGLLVKSVLAAILFAAYQGVSSSLA